ncbi:hypothetical protein L1987_52376 [Smallanthus sonchifolius]|uniref:Uncharacterized protein n=1 Tax=Smallanthus sonchifolius TaxID=185202 RepID=A0ACB9ETJ9_9ASTR|nr:hypothetical protein L1987_52376 [Smallanthus sonchifolius]
MSPSSSSKSTITPPLIQCRKRKRERESKISDIHTRFKQICPSIDSSLHFPQYSRSASLPSEISLSTVAGVQSPICRRSDDNYEEIEEFLHAHEASTYYKEEMDLSISCRLNRLPLSTVSPNLNFTRRQSHLRLLRHGRKLGVCRRSAPADL